MRVATFNIDGLKDSEAYAAKLFEHQRLDVLGLQETWTRPGDPLPPWITAAVSAPVPARAIRGFGGVAVVVNPAVKHQVVCSRATKTYQFIILSISGMHLAVVYLSPLALKNEALECLNAVKRLAPPPTAIVGDFNARHVDWDHEGNYRGALLKKWCADASFSVQAPSEPTFVSHQGQSTIDLGLLKDCSLTHLEVVNGVWTGVSGHSPVVLHIEGVLIQQGTSTRISQARRVNEFCQDTAAHFFARAFPKFTQRFKDCQSPQDLQRCYDHFLETFVCPWEDQGHRPRRFRHFWNRRLEGLARERARMRNRAHATGNSQDWEAFFEFNKRVKREARREKRASSRKEFERLAYKTPSRANSILATALKSMKNFAVQSSDAGRTLDPAEFTHFLAQQATAGAAVTPRRFAMSDKVREAITRSLKRMKGNRAAGLDEVFIEGLQLVTKESTELLWALWEACGRLNATPAQFGAAEVIPLHKKGDTGNPVNYRPIALISHVRKVIDKALDLLIRQEHVFHKFQVGFRSRMGTEAAILRAVDSLQCGYQYVACLDLRAAYDSVPRGKLMRRLRRVLSKSLCDMISHTLQASSICTRGDASREQGTIQAGVQQGSPASPALFNIYIDDLAETIEKLAGFDADRAAILYADDVLLIAKKPWELQRLLDIVSWWASRNGMAWNTAKSAVMIPVDERRLFTLAGDVLTSAKEIEYLGVALTLQGVSETITLKRVQAAHAKWSAVRNLEKRLGTLPTTTAVTLFKTVVQPVAEYGMHLCPVTREVVRKFELLEARLIRKALGKVPAKEIPRARKLLRLQSFSQRRCVLITKMLLRAQAVNESSTAMLKPGEAAMRIRDAQTVIRWHEAQGRPPNTTREDIHRSWRALCEHRKRQIPNPLHGIIPALRLRNPSLRRYATRYYFTRFPTGSDTTTMERLHVAGEDPTSISTIRILLARPQLSPSETNALACAIDAIQRAESTVHALYSAPSGHTLSKVSPGNARD